MTSHSPYLKTLIVGRQMPKLPSNDLGKLFHDLLAPTRSLGMLSEIAQDSLGNDKNGLEKLMLNGRNSILKSTAKARNTLSKVAEQNKEAASLFQAIEGHFLPQLEYINEQLNNTAIWKDEDALHTLARRTNQLSQDNVKFRHGIYSSVTR